MKKILTTLFCACALTAQAQKVSGDFDAEWEKCVPWTSDDANKEVGKQPQGWKLSNVYAVIAKISVGEKIANGDGSAVKLTNQNKFGNLVPAYLTLGTPWATAKLSGIKPVEGTADGGTWGGIEFTYHPDALSFDYIRDNSNGTENATVVAYLWKGKYEQADVPGNTAANPTIKTMVNRDRNILEMPTTVGGNVSSEGAAKIASFIHQIDASTNSKWVNKTIEFDYGDYKNQNIDVENINIIFSANDYFGNRNAIVANNSLTVDNVKLVYYHALNALAYEGANIEFNETTTHYDLSNVVYEPAKLSYTKKGQGATVTSSYDDATAMLTIRVTAEDYNETTNPDAFTEYTIQFKKAPKDVKEYANTLLVNVAGENVPAQDNTVIKLLKYENPESYSFLLENFSLGEELLIGDIQVDNLARTVQNGKEVYAGQQKLTLEALGNLEVDVTVEATVVGDNMTAHISIPVEGLGDVNVDYAPALNIASEQTLAVTEGGKHIVTLNRSFKKGWNTLALPFAIPATAFGENVKAQAFVSADANGLNFAKTENIEANTPYLVYFPNEVTDPLYFVATVAATTATNDVAHGDYTFKCNYEAGFDMEGNYGVADVDGVQKIMLGTTGSSLLATGAYFTSTSAKANGMKINMGGQTTGIEGITGETSGNGAVYNLQGVKVSAGSLNGLPRGIYVQNGRKVIVK